MTRKEKLEEVLQILKEKGNNFMYANVMAELQKLERDERKT